MLLYLEAFEFNTNSDPGCINPFPDYKNLTLSKLQAFADFKLM